MLQNRKSARASLKALLVCILSISISLLFLPTTLSYHNQALAQISPAASADYLQYTNPTYGVEIQYPNDWQQLQEGLLEDILNRAGINDTIPIAEFLPSDKSVSVVIGVEKLVENLTLDQYMEKYIAGLKENDPNFRIIEQNRTTTPAGTSGYTLVNNGTVDVASVFQEAGLNDVFGETIDYGLIARTAVSFFTIHDNNAFGVVYTDANGQMLRNACKILEGVMPVCASLTNIDDPYSHYLPIAEKIIDSFKITTQNQTNSTHSPPMGNDTQPASEDACSIIDIRLARGDITIEKYEELRGILEC